MVGYSGLDSSVPYHRPAGRDVVHPHTGTPARAPTRSATPLPRTRTPPHTFTKRPRPKHRASAPRRAKPSRQRRWHVRPLIVIDSACTAGAIQARSACRAPEKTVNSRPRAGIAPPAPGHRPLSRRLDAHQGHDPGARHPPGLRPQPRRLRSVDRDPRRRLAQSQRPRRQRLCPRLGTPGMSLACIRRRQPDPAGPPRRSCNPA